MESPLNTLLKHLWEQLIIKNAPRGTLTFQKDKSLLKKIQANNEIVNTISEKNRASQPDYHQNAG